MPTVSTLAKAFVATLQAGVSVAQGGASTATAVISGLERRIPFLIQFSQASADPFVEVYRAEDGGTNYDTLPLTSVSISRNPGGPGQSSVGLPMGVYALVFRNYISGVSTATFQVLTAEEITAWVNT